MKPIKKVPIIVYVPAGDICEGATFKCPLLMESANLPSCFCAFIPDSFWWNYERKTKNKLCPSLFKRGNKLSEEDIKNHRLRIIEKAIKNRTFDNLENQLRDEEDD